MKSQKLCANKTVFLFDQKIETGGGIKKIMLTNISEPAKSYSADLNGTITIVRGLNNTIVIADDKSVSQHHCEIFERNRTVCIQDAGSSNGVTIAGKRIIAPTAIENGTVIMI